jgi:hypothetical protein
MEFSCGTPPQDGAIRCGSVFPQFELLNSLLNCVRFLPGLILDRVTPRPSGAVYVWHSLQRGI